MIPIGFMVLALMCSVEAVSRPQPWRMLSAAGACIFFAVMLSP